VGPTVLVPRPETELLVELALALALPAAARVLDLGTGSGAIALALAHERPAWRVTATDLSPQALATARTNAHTLGLTVELLEGSWLAPLADRQFELIVSNPPYIAASDPALSDPALRHEPRLALTPGEDGLASLAAIIRAAPAHLACGGWLLLEHGAGQAPDVQRELTAQGFTAVRSHVDLAGHLRVTAGRWGAEAKM
jgi:release factor glutamine methyltransferase